MEQFQQHATTALSKVNGHIKQACRDCSAQEPPSDVATQETPANHVNASSSTVASLNGKEAPQLASTPQVLHQQIEKLQQQVDNFGCHLNDMESCKHDAPDIPNRSFHNCNNTCAKESQSIQLNTPTTATLQLQMVQCQELGSCMNALEEAILMASQPQVPS